MAEMQLSQVLAMQWAKRCFGDEHVRDTRVRAVRLAEEAIELAQSLNVPADQLHKLIDYIYGNKKGIPRQEIGGVCMTLSVLCSALNLDLQEEFEIELMRVLSKSPEEFKKRNELKIEAGFDGG